MLADYDVDGSGTVSVAELVAGAQLMRQQAKKVCACAAALWVRGWRRGAQLSRGR